MIYRKLLIYLFILPLFIVPASGQKVLTLREAVETAVANYPSIKAKANYVNASKATVEQTKREALPNLVLSMQLDFGTVNGQNGPSYGLGGYGVASSGAALAGQNWNSGFGGLYLSNVNWDFFAFGRARERVKAAQTYVNRDENDRQQELFQHEIRTAAAYLNLVAAQRITRSQQYNLDRADTILYVVVARAKNGLIAGVDSSQANAEVSNARTALILARDAEQERANQLAQLMGIVQTDFLLDSVFLTKIPALFTDTATIVHPLLQFYKSRIEVSDQQLNYIKTLKYPTFSLFGVLQTRGSGFSSNYSVDQTAYTHNFFDGINPNRSNYLLGVGATWNITSITRVHQQEKAQGFVSKGLQEEYNTIDLQLKAQQSLSESKITNALANYKEAPIQVKSATDAYVQRSVLYKNGLTNIVDVTQTLYALNRAETNRDIAYSNVWQSLLLKAAANGDFNFFISQVK